MIINDRFRVDRDKMNWILQDITMSKATKGKNKGKTVERISESYYGNLGALCRHCIDKSLDPDGGFYMMQEQLNAIHADLEKMIKKHDLNTRRAIAEAAK